MKSIEKKIFMKGGCDIDAVAFYLDQKNITKEGSVWDPKHGVIYYTGHSEIFGKQYNDSIDCKQFTSPVSYKTEAFSKKYNVIVISVIIECLAGVYEHKVNKNKIVYGESATDATTNIDDYLNKKCYLSFNELNREDYIELSNKYNFIGKNIIENTIKNYEQIINNIDVDTKIVFLLGPEVHDEIKETSKSYIKGDAYFERLNAEIKKSFGKYPNIYFINPNPLLEKHKKSKYFYYNSQSMSHYKRYVYKKMARELCKIDKNFIFTYKHAFKRKVKHILVKNKIFKKILKKRNIC